MSQFAGWLARLETTQLATAISESTWLFPTIETVHVLAITLVVGSITMVDLRLLGLSMRRRPVAELLVEVLPWTWTSFAVAVTSGALLFASAATHYWGTAPFRAKMLLLGLAGANMLVFHLAVQRRAQAGAPGSGTDRGAKISGGISLCLWIGIVGCGRWIGFV
jgi:hypothetical protein